MKKIFSIIIIDFLIICSFGVQGFSKQEMEEAGLLKKESPLTSVNVLLAPIMVNEMYRRVQIEIPAASIDLEEYVEAFL